MRKQSWAALFGLIPIQEGMLSSAHVYVYTHLLSSADRIFDKNMKTEAIFATLAYPIVRSLMEGFNGKCVPCKPRFHLLHPLP